MNTLKILYDRTIGSSQIANRKRKLLYLFSCGIISLHTFLFLGCQASDTHSELEANSVVSQLSFPNGQKNIKISGALSLTHSYSTVPDFPVLRWRSGVNLIPSYAEQATSVSFTKFISSQPLRYAFDYRTCTEYTSQGDGIAILLGKDPDSYALLSALPLGNQGSLS